MPWLEDKMDNPMKVEFPNLPYLIDEKEDVRISQSGAILRYVANRAGLMGKTDKERALNNQMIEECVDFRGKLGIAYSPNFKEEVKGFAEKDFPSCLSTLNQYFDRKKTTFLLGATPLACDFLWFEVLDNASTMAPQCVEGTKKDQYKLVFGFMEAMKALPKVAEYRKHPTFIQRPINNAMAAFK